MNRRSFLRSAGLAAGCCLLPALRSNATTKGPNFIFIFADDVGWGDLSCYGQKNVETPNLDQLASEGTLFTQFYVAGSVCSPSRASIMTGQFPARLGIHDYLADKESNARRQMPNFLDPDTPNLTRTLQANGYRTGHFGKWHLGSTEDAPLPNAYGIDESKTFVSNDPEGKGHWDLYDSYRRPYSTQTILDETFDFIKENKDKPFYVNAWLIDMHATLNPTVEQMARHEKWNRAPGVTHYGATQIYYAALDAMDKQIGEFLQRLDAFGIMENTVVIFSSDNGPEDIHIFNAAHSGVGCTGPFRGRKRSLYEGGVRMPFIVRWPQKIPAGRVDDTSVLGGVDFYPTICSLAGIDVDTSKIDGEDMSECFLGKSQKRSKSLMWEWRGKVFGHVMHKSPMLAIRDGDWKLLMNPDESRVELYDIVKDPREMDNLATDYPHITQKLAKKLMTWQKTLPKGPIRKEAGQNEWDWPGD